MTSLVLMELNTLVNKPLLIRGKFTLLWFKRESLNPPPKFKIHYLDLKFCTTKRGGVCDGEKSNCSVQNDNTALC